MTWSGMKIQGVTPEYVKQIQELGLKADAEELVGMKIQGVSPEYVREMRKLDLKVDTGELMGMKIQGSHSGVREEHQRAGLASRRRRIDRDEGAGSRRRLLEQDAGGGFQIGCRAMRLAQR